MLRPGHVAALLMGRVQSAAQPQSQTAMKDLTEAERRTLYRMPHSVRATFLLWRIGINPKYTIAAETYRRHRALLAEKFGVDITALP